MIRASLITNHNLTYLHIIIMKQLITLAFILFAVNTIAQPKIENNQLVLNGPITFKPGTDKFSNGVDSLLTQIKDFMVSKSFVTLLRVEGHVASGNDASDQALSEKRALAVVRWLVDKGVDSKRLLPVGFGSTKPVSGSNAQNTRIVFALAALRGNLIGGMPADGGGKIAGTR